ncbi:hypothetical protein [Enterococcus faecalis]|nr:hypothetical protein A4V06_14725 [Enterococcus faecalis]ASU26356.1 hypothetical protein ADH73_09915 [Enterococcus faecalis]MBG9437469.1 hypothetical protein [Enterococcus faecalis]MBG9440245.1 hypothetical protein [Enterococcus faecalis]MBG9443025.1 hypothetical protein [Enterococcus faecalis]
MSGASSTSNAVVDTVKSALGKSGNNNYW